MDAKQKWEIVFWFVFKGEESQTEDELAKDWTGAEEAGRFNRPRSQILCRKEFLPNAHQKQADWLAKCFDVSSSSHIGEFSKSFHGPLTKCLGRGCSWARIALGRHGFDLQLCNFFGLLVWCGTSSSSEVHWPFASFIPSLQGCDMWAVFWRRNNLCSVVHRSTNSLEALGEIQTAVTRSVWQPCVFDDVFVFAPGDRVE